MRLPFQLTDADLDANQRAIASAIARHPVSPLFTSATVAALDTIATSAAPAFTADERQFLAAIDAAELTISRRAA